jgi:hypothetical protein
MINRQWSNHQSSIVNGQIINGQSSIINGQSSMVNGQWSLVNRQSSIKATTNPYSLLKLFTGFINAALML